MESVLRILVLRPFRAARNCCPQNSATLGALDHGHFCHHRRLVCGFRDHVAGAPVVSGPRNLSPTTQKPFTPHETYLAGRVYTARSNFSWSQLRRPGAGRNSFLSSYARSGDWRPLQPCAVFHIACQSISSSISTDRPPDRCAHLHSVRKSHAGHVRTVSMARRTSAAYSNPLCGSGWLVHRLLAVRVRDISALRVSNEDDTRLDRAETLPAAPALGLSTTEFVGFGSLQREPGCGRGERRLRRSQYEVDSIAASGPMK